MAAHGSGIPSGSMDVKKSTEKGRNRNQGGGKVTGPKGPKKTPGVTPGGTTTGRTGNYGSGKK